MLGTHRAAVAALIILALLRCRPDDQRKKVDLAGLNGGEGGEIVVEITPAYASIGVRQTVQLSVSVLGPEEKEVTWVVVEDGGGSIDESGLYRAPSAPGLFHVTATSQADGVTFATATLEVHSPTVAIAPMMAELGRLETASFSAAAQYAEDPTVTFSIAEPDGGSLTSLGAGLVRYTAPATLGTYHVVANVPEVPSVQATVVVRAIEVTLTPRANSVSVGDAIDFSATVQFAAISGAVTFAVAGADGERIDANGHYVAPSKPGVYTVTASSAQDPSRLATATVTVAYRDRFAIVGAAPQTMRADHTATVLANGKVLVTGGRADLASTTAIGSATLYDPASHTFLPTDALNEARYGHTATLLPSGSVLIAGGCSGGARSNTLELFEPNGNGGIGAFATTGLPTLNAARCGHSATLLADGRVLLAGGEGTSATPAGEVIDLTAMPITSTPTASNAIRDHHASVRTNGGDVMFFGGTDSAGMYVDTSQRLRVSSAPNGGTFDATQTMPPSAPSVAPNVRAFLRASLMQLGGTDYIWVAGGEASASSPRNTTSLLRYSMASGSYADFGALYRPRARFTMTPLNDNRLLLTGGMVDGAGGAYARDATAEIIAAPSAAILDQSLVPLPMLEARAGHTATLLQDGKVLIIGGAQNGGAFAERFD